MLEHIYTASPKGLDPNRSGFVTVAFTNGFPPNLISPLENLSGYKALYAPGDPQVEANPANYSFQHYGTGSGSWYVVSRITYAGPSYTGRSNNLAHHLLFSREELTAIPGGASAILSDERNWVPYSGTPGLLPVRRCHHDVSVAAQKGATWARLCGSGDWAHVVAERFREDRTKGVVLQFMPGAHSVTDILALVSEVVVWLTPEEAVDFTFSTYCYQSAIGNPVFFRAYTADSPYLASARRLNPQGVIVLGEENPFGADEDRLLRIYRERVRQAQERKQERRALTERTPLPKKPELTTPPAPCGEVTIVLSGTPEAPYASVKSSTTGWVRTERTRQISGQPEPQKHSNRILVFVILVAVLALLGFGAVLFWTQISAHFPGHKEDGGGISGLDRISAWFVSHSSRKEPEPVAAGAEAPDAEPIAVPPEPSVVEEVSEPAEVMPVQVVDDVGEDLQFFEDFLLSRRTSIPLPTRFAAGGMMSVELSGIGEKDLESISDGVGALSQSDENCCVVYPLEWTDDATHLNRILVVTRNQSENRLVLEIVGGKLKVQEPVLGETLPCRNNIKRILIDDAVLFSQEFTVAMKDRLSEMESVSGSVDLARDGRLIGRASCSDRLLKYRDFVHLMVSVIRWNKSIYSQIPVELRDIGHEINILNLGEASEFNRECQTLSMLKENLSRGHTLRKNFFENDVPRIAQTLNKNIQAVNDLRQYITNKEITILEHKKKPLKVKINAEETMEQICEALDRLQKHFNMLCEENSQVSQALFNEEIEKMKYGLQYFSAVLQDLSNPATVNREGYELDCQNIQRVIVGTAAIVDTARMWLDSRLKIEANLIENEKEIQSTQEEINHARSALASKLQGILSPESYGKNFKTLLEGDGYSPIDLEMLRGELQKECSLEFRLELR